MSRLIFPVFQNSEYRVVGTSKENEKEAETVIDTLRKLLDGGDVLQKDIGVISPYKAQVSPMYDTRNI